MADHIIDLINTQPGIQRDGTPFNSIRYIDGQWVRFYMGKPMQIGGRFLVDPGTPEIIRNAFGFCQQHNSMDAYLGRPSTLSVCNLSDVGIANPEFDRTPTNFVDNPNNMWSFTLYTVLGVTSTVNLANNPITTDGVTATVVVTVPSTYNLSNEQFVTIRGAAPTGGINAVNLNITAPISIINLTSFSYTATALSTGGVPITGGGNGVSYTSTGNMTNIVATAAPNLLDINNDIEGLIYWGDVGATTPLTEISSAVPISISLGTNPIHTTNGFGTIAVTVPSTALLTTGTIVTISGAVDTNAITAAQINITTPIAVLTPTIFVYASAGVANATGNGGGTNVSYAYTQPPSHQKTSGFVLAAPPYLIKGGNDGVLGWTLNPGGSWGDAQFAPIAGTKLVYGALTRGGSNSPAFLIWSLNSLIRASFIGGEATFQFDTIQTGISIISQNCVVTVENVFYWIGTNQFYIYNGVVKRIINNTNKVWFFKNINREYANKITGIYKPQFNEIWWNFPYGDSIENNRVIIYNIEEDIWSDSRHSRTCGIQSDLFPYPLEADSNAILNQFNPTRPITVNLANNPLTTTNASNVVVVAVPSTTGLFTGNQVTIAGAATTNGITALQLNITAPIVVINNTSFSYVANGVAGPGAPGGGNAVTFTYIVPNLCYGLWEEEIGTDEISYGQSLAIDSYFETNYITYFEKVPTDDRLIRIRRIEPDFIMTNNMTLTINSRSFAQSIPTTSNVYTFVPGQTVVEIAKIDTINMGRLVSLRFESNISGGSYLMGKVVVSFAPGDVSP